MMDHLPRPEMKRPGTQKGQSKIMSVQDVKTKFKLVKQVQPTLEIKPGNKARALAAKEEIHPTLTKTDVTRGSDLNKYPVYSTPKIQHLNGIRPRKLTMNISPQPHDASIATPQIPSTHNMRIAMQLPRKIVNRQQESSILVSKVSPVQQRLEKPRTLTKEQQMRKKKKEFFKNQQRETWALKKRVLKMEKIIGSRKNDKDPKELVQNPQLASPHPWMLQPWMMAPRISMPPIMPPTLCPLPPPQFPIPSYPGYFAVKYS